jgi:1,5-anhydro-D-fructose reductase (1,5-anhydro-D-mannitol-forming)
MRIGLAGLGDAGRHHARALRAMGAAGEITWAAACGRDCSGRARQFCDAEGGGLPVEAFADLDAMLEGARLDAVILATPDGLHVDQALAALARGIHVLVEKPLALDVEGARRAVAAAAGARRALAVGYHLRHHEGHRVVHERLPALVGSLRRIEARWAWPDPATSGWRARGEAARYWSLAALGTHLVDLALWLGGETETARVVADVRRRDGADIAADATIRFPSGVVAELGVSVEYRSMPRLSLVGTEGEVECLGTLGARGAGTIVRRTPRGETEPVPFTPADPYLLQLRAFVDDARPPSKNAPVAGGATALAVVEIVERIASGGDDQPGGPRR